MYVSSYTPSPVPIDYISHVIRYSLGAGSLDGSIYCAFIIIVTITTRQTSVLSVTVFSSNRMPKDEAHSLFEADERRAIRRKTGQEQHKKTQQGWCHCKFDEGSVVNANIAED